MMQDLTQVLEADKQPSAAVVSVKDDSAVVSSAAVAARPVDSEAKLSSQPRQGVRFCAHPWVLFGVPPLVFALLVWRWNGLRPFLGRYIVQPCVSVLKMIAQ
jgi:hypothetical protein